MAESNRALVVIDTTEALFRGPHAIPGAMTSLRFVLGELKYFRERARPVFFACTVTDDADVQKPPTILAELTPRSDERVFIKQAPSVFFDTDLHDTLQRLQVRRLTFVGTETNTSVMLSAADAIARGYEVVVPEPCVCARDPLDHSFALKQIRQVWPHWPEPAGEPTDFDETGRLRRPRQ